MSRNTRAQIAQVLMVCGGSWYGAVITGTGEVCYLRCSQPGVFTDNIDQVVHELKRGYFTARAQVSYDFDAAALEEVLVIDGTVSADHQQIQILPGIEVLEGWNPQSAIMFLGPFLLLEKSETEHPEKLLANLDWPEDRKEAVTTGLKRLHELFRFTAEEAVWPMV